MSDLPFVDAVSQRCGESPANVQSTLEALGIGTAALPPPTAHLRLVRVAFTGTKIVHGESIPVDFEWKLDSDGLWGVATEDNLAGKTSLVQIVFWALRGSPKHLSKTVKGWLKTVETDFQAGSEHIAVRFELLAGVPKGTVTVSGAAAPTSFDDEEAFTIAMDGIMRNALGMSRIPATQRIGEEVHEYEDGWAALAIGLISDTHSDAIIGEAIPGTPFTGRLLQMFVGIPWAMPLLQIQARRRKLDSEAALRKRKITKLGPRSVESLKSDIADITRRIEENGAGDRAAQDLLAAQIRFGKARADVFVALDRVADRRAFAAAAKNRRVDAERAALALREESAATTFLHRLKPVCCPRCSTAIGEDRRQREATQHRCSVCDTAIAQLDPNAAIGEIESAEARTKELRGLERNAQATLDVAEALLGDAERERDAADFALKKLSALGVAGDIRRLEQQRERLEGMLELSILIEGADLAVGTDSVILAAAQDEAEERVNASSADVLSRASEEIVRILRQLGMQDVEALKLGRNASAKLTKGGSCIYLG